MGTPVTHEQMSRMFESNRKANMEILKATQTAINATTREQTHKIDVKLDTVITRQNDQNDAVKKNEKKITENKKKITEVEETTGFVNRLKKNTKWIILGLFGFCYVTAWIYQNIDIVDLIKNLILNKL